MIYKIHLELEGAEVGITGTTYNVDRNTWALLRDALEGRITLKAEEKEGRAEPVPGPDETGLE